MSESNATDETAEVIAALRSMVKDPSLSVEYSPVLIVAVRLISRRSAAPADREALYAAAYTMMQFARDANLAGCTTGFGVFMRRERAIEAVKEILDRSLKSPPTAAKE